MNIEKYFKSISLELTALKNRVRDFIDDSHWLTDGEWKESVIRSVLSRNLPNDIQIGRGFILTPDNTSTQIDILLYSSDSPVLFRDGDLVFIQPEGVRGVIEVKTNLNHYKLKEAVKKLKKIGAILQNSNNFFLSIFSYDSNIDKDQKILDLLEDETNSIYEIIHFMCLGDSRFIRYWKTDPNQKIKDEYEKWHSYRLGEMAYGYFIHTVLLKLSPEYIDYKWFPEMSKEIHKDGEIQRRRGIEEGVNINDRF